MTPDTSSTVCTSCGETLVTGAKFCHACGAVPAGLLTACTACGTELAAGAKFCHICAAGVAQAAVAVIVPAQAAVPEPISPPAEPTRSKRRILVATVVAGVVFLACAAGGGYWWSTRDIGSAETPAAVGVTVNIPTPDQPRYTREQVRAAIGNHTYVCTNTFGCSFAVNQGDMVRATCVDSGLSYVGNGLWKCGTWSFDERTGLVF